MATLLAPELANAVTTYTDRATWEAAVDAIAGSTRATETLNDWSNITATECAGNYTGCGSVGPGVFPFLNWSGESIDSPLVTLLLEYNGAQTGNVFVQNPGDVDGSPELNGGGTGSSNFILNVSFTEGTASAFGFDFANTHAGRYSARVDFADGTSSASVPFAGAGFLGFISPSGSQIANLDIVLNCCGYTRSGHFDNFSVGTLPVNEPPTADAGSDQSIRAGDTVDLDGSASFDDNTATAALTYAWSFVPPLPEGSTATLTGADTATPSFVADVAGTYVVQLIVTDEAGLESAPDEVGISSDNLPPTAAAGEDQLIILGDTVDFDGSGSTDPENDLLTFAWAITSAPAGSVAPLGGDDTETPSLVPDLEGVYEVTLTVSDFIGPGTPDTVAITVASAGAFAEIQIVSASDSITSLAADQVTTGGNQNALLNFLTQAIVALQADPPDVAEAINKLEKAISRTDGCVLRGSPDGNGSGRDWITDCAAQVDAYYTLNAALDALMPTP